MRHCLNASLRLMSVALVAAAAFAGCSEKASVDAMSADDNRISAEQCAAATDWAPNAAYATGAVVRFGGAHYACVQGHTSLASWTPDATPALWQQVVCAPSKGADGGDAGTSGNAGDSGQNGSSDAGTSTSDSGGNNANDGSNGNNGNNGSGTLAKHALIGYWHNFANPSGPAFPLGQVSNDWDVIDVAFASNAQPSGSVDFQLDPSLDVAQFKADVAAKRAAGKKVVLSLGGQDGTVSLNSASDVDNFVSSLTNIVKTYGFDGLDIDLESGAGVLHGAPVQTNLVTAVKRIRANTLGDKFYLSMAPEHPYVQGGLAANTGIWGAYLPIIEGLRAELTVLHVQLYNNGALQTPWGTYQATTVDMLVGSVDMLLAGFQPASGPAFAPLRADQVAFGMPSGPTAANPGNFATAATIQAAYDCIATGASCGTHKPSKTYPAFRGVMTWSINWDKHDGPASFSQPLAAFLHGKP